MSRRAKAQRVADVLLGLAVILVACGGAPRRASYPVEPVSIALDDVDGGRVSFADFRGKIVVVHFFATWSLAAFADVEEIRALRREFPHTEVVGVGLDPNGAVLLAPWRETSAVDWWVVTPDAATSAGDTPFGKVVVVPTTFLLDGGGRIIWHKVGQLAPGELAGKVRDLETGRADP